MYDWLCTNTYVHSQYFHSQYFYSQVTSTKSCERGSSPAPPSPGEEEAITITNSHTRCFSAFKLFYHLFGQIFVKICVKLIITHPTNLHTRWLSQRCVFGFYIFSHLFCCQKSCQAYNHLLGRRRQPISWSHHHPHNHPHHHQADPHYNLFISNKYPQIHNFPLLQPLLCRATHLLA